MRAPASPPRGLQLTGRDPSTCSQEPFWPEGLGINRGFLGALDCAYLVQHYAALAREPTPTTESLTVCIDRREELFTLTKSLSAHNRLVELRPHLEGSASQSDAEKHYCYTINPSTRYSRAKGRRPSRTGLGPLRGSDTKENAPAPQGSDATPTRVHMDPAMANANSGVSQTPFGAVLAKLETAFRI